MSRTTQGAGDRGAHGGRFRRRGIINKTAECERRFGTTQNGRVPSITRCREECGFHCVPAGEGDAGKARPGTRGSRFEPCFSANIGVINFSRYAFGTNE
jgi:hypothetical protein